MIHAKKASREENEAASTVKEISTGIMSFQGRLIWLGERLKDLEDRLDEPQSSAGRRRKSDIEFSALPLGNEVGLRARVRLH